MKLTDGELNCLFLGLIVGAIIAMIVIKIGVYDAQKIDCQMEVSALLQTQRIPMRGLHLSSFCV